MTIEIAELPKCRFCREVEAGRLFLNVLAISDMHENRADCYTPAAEAMDVLMFNSPRRKQGPCPHFLQITLNISCDSGELLYPSRPEWETCVAYLNPEIGEIDPHNVVGDLRGSLVFGLEHEEFLPNEPHSFDVIDENWQGFGASGKPDRLFHVEGRVAFAQRIPEFMDGLFHNEKLRQEARRAGRDPRREWAEIKQQKEREAEEADLRAEREMEAAFGPQLRRRRRS